MASIVDAFHEAFSEDFAYLKIVLYSIPVNFVVDLYMKGKMQLFEFWGFIVGMFLLGLLTAGINNVRMNKKEILTFNPLHYLKALGKTIVVVVPHLILFGLIGNLLVTKVHIPIDLPWVPTIFKVIVWSIIFSIIFTSYLSFAKYLKMKEGFNYKVISECCIDVLIAFAFFVPQLALANLVLLIPVAYLFFFFKLPFTHWGFIAYCCMVLIVNISMLSNYLAQCAYEHIKGNNDEYDENCQIDMIVTADDIHQGKP